MLLVLREVVLLLLLPLLSELRLSRCPWLLQALFLLFLLVVGGVSLDGSLRDAAGSASVLLRDGSLVGFALELHDLGLELNLLPLFVGGFTLFQLKDPFPSFAAIRF